MESTKYFSTSWKMVTRDKGWIKPVLVMAAATFVPVAGTLGNLGYALEYGRLTAWGVDGTPKQKNVDVGKCIASGWRGFVVSLGLGLLFAIPVAILMAIINLLPGAVGAAISGMLNMATSVLGAFISIVIYVAQLRAAIYEKIGAGFQFARLKELVQRDTQGIAKLFLIQFLFSICIGVVAGIIVVLVIVMYAPFIATMASGNYRGLSEYEIVSMVLQPLIWVIPIMMIIAFALSLVSCIMQLVLMNAVGLWMRQFSVPSWGKSEDPLPDAPQQGTPGPAYYQLPQQSMTQRPPMTQQGQAIPQRPAPQTQQMPRPVPVPSRGESAQDDVAGVTAVPLVRKPADEPTEQPTAILDRPDPIPMAVVQPEEDKPAEESAQEETAVIEMVPVPKESAATQPDRPSSDDGADDIDDMYDDMLDAIRENDRVPEDDDQ